MGESVRKVVARGNTNNSEAKMELLDKKISEQIAKDRADEEVPNEEAVATVKATESKAAAAKKQLVSAEAKLNEVQQDGSSDDMIHSVKTMLAQAKAASAQAEEEVANATKAAESIGVRKLSLSLANMTNMLARNGSFMENIFRRDNALVMKTPSTLQHLALQALINLRPRRYCQVWRRSKKSLQLWMVLLVWARSALSRWKMLILNRRLSG